MFEIPFEVPTTAVLKAGPGAESLVSYHAIVRDSLKRVRNERNPDLLSAVRSLQDYIPLVLERLPLETTDFAWRLPWSAPSTKTARKSGDYERSMATLCLILILTRAAGQAQHQQNYKQTTAFLMEALSRAIYLSETPPNGLGVPELEAATLKSLVHLLDGLIHQMTVLKTVSTVLTEPLAAPSAMLHARIAMHAADEYARALPLAPKQLKSWVQSQHTYCQAAARLFTAIEQSQKGQTGVAIGQLIYGESLAKKDKDHKDLTTILEALRKRYESENKQVSFQAVPTASSLPPLPTGRRIVQATAWGGTRVQGQGYF